MTTQVHRLLQDIKAGAVSANTTKYHHPANPFGGYKASGIGRQGGRWGFHEACQVKIMSLSK